MHYLSPNQDAALKTLVADYVSTIMGDPNTDFLHEDDADIIGDTFYAILMDDHVNPGGPVRQGGDTAEQAAALKSLVEHFVSTYMADRSTAPLHQGDADDISDTFFGMLMDDFVAQDGSLNEVSETC